MVHMNKHRKVYTSSIYGFDRVEDRIEENLLEFAVRDQINSWRLDEQLTLAEIACRLNAQGIPGKLGGKWYPTTVRNVLRNEIYLTSH